MHVVMLSWLKGKPVGTIQGYGGIERMVATLTKELIRQGHQVTLITPPGSFIEGAILFETTSFVEARNWINDIKPDVVHDHSCWSLESPARGKLLNPPTLSTTHVMHAVSHSRNVVFLSESQRRSHGEQLVRDLSNSPVIRVPTDPDLKPKGLKRLDYLLFLGSVQPHKGVHHAAEVAFRLGRRLIVAGPAAGEYADHVASWPCVEMVGEVTGEYRDTLIEQAHALMCLHNEGDMGWLEPGCGVVGEAGAFNTPVAAFPNGCLAEIVVTGANGWLGGDLDRICHLMDFAYPTNPGYKARTEWSSEQIVRQYVSLYERVIGGETWG